MTAAMIEEPVLSAHSSLPPLRGHHRFDYLPINRRRDYDWPGGARLAVYLGFNLEHFAFGEGLGARLGPPSPEPDVLNWSWREYGNRVGAWRCLQLFDQLALPAATLINTSLYDHCPELIEACVARGDELVGHGHTNSMRVVMNTSKNPYTYVDVKNIPVGKWFHVVLNCFKGGLDVYVNGNLASRIPFVNAVPYQNYQDVLFFSQPNFRFLGAQIAALGEENIEIQGAFDGMLSSMKYARYALSMNEITKLMNEGPSSKRKSAAIATPPYLADTWWAQQRA